MKTSIGRLPLFQSLFAQIPRCSLNSFSGTAPALSILLPKITIGTFYNQGIYSMPCSSILLSQNLLKLEESTRQIIPSTSDTQFLQVLRAASWPPKSHALKVIFPIVSYYEQGCWVGSICFITSSFNRSKSVVFPASSNPKNTIFAFLLTKPKLSRVDLNQLKIHMPQIEQFSNQKQLFKQNHLLNMTSSLQSKHKKEIISYNNVNMLVNQNRELITQLPALLYRHLEYYEKIHESNCDQITNRMPFSESVEQEIQMLKDCSVEFVSHLATIKNHFNAILTKQVEIEIKTTDKKSLNFQAFISEHCQSVVKEKIDKIKQIIPQEEMYEPSEHRI